MSDLGKWPEANDLLDRALDHPPEERRAFIGREAGHNPDLAEALLDVLAEAEQDDGFLERSGLAMAGLLSEAWEEAHEAEPPALEPGQRFTTYAVLELVLGVTGTAAGVAHFAHLGGMLGGYLMIRYRRGFRN